MAMSNRDALINVSEKSVLFAQLKGESQENDSFFPVNCKGFGRIRRYKSFSLHLEEDGQKPKPLLRGLTDLPFETQTFQTMGCQLRCWFCFVDYKHLSTNSDFGSFLTARDLVSLHLDEQIFRPVIDISGGDPGLVPELALWIHQELANRSLSRKIRVWADDNLWSDTFFRVLKRNEIEALAHSPGHSKTFCLKGFDEASFAFNTGRPPSGFDHQLSLLQRHYETKIDFYLYVTVTGPETSYKQSVVDEFFRKLQSISPLLPLRTIPLKIDEFTNCSARLTQSRKASLSDQRQFSQLWNNRIGKEFPNTMRELPYHDVKIH